MRGTKQATHLGTLLLVAALFATGCCYAQSPRILRPMEPTDLFRIEEVGDVAISPDGMDVAYVRKRPMATGVDFGVLAALNRSDVWLSSPATGHSVNITEGKRDNSGFWAPKWSPGGTKLAMVSTRGGDVGIWVWSQSSKTLTDISGRWLAGYTGNWAWISDSQIVFFAVMEGSKSDLSTLDTDISEVTARAWLQARQGRQPTTNILQSGIEPSLEERRQAQILLVDTDRGQTQVLGSGPHFASLSISPNRRSIAFLRQVGTWRPNPERSIRPWLRPEAYEVSIADLSSPLQVRSVEGVIGVFAGSLLWSPDNQYVAVIGYVRDRPSDQEQLFICEAVAGKCSPIHDIDLHLSQGLNYFDDGKPPYLWLGRHQLLAYGFASTLSESEKRLDGPKWWSIGPEGRAVPMFSDSAVPAQVIADPTRDGLIVLAGGKIWRVGSNGRKEEDLAPGIKEVITSIKSGDHDPLDEIVLETESPANNLYTLDLSSRRVRTLIKPAPSAVVAAHNAQSGITIFSKVDHSGTYLWLEDRELRYVSVLETNTFLRDIAESDFRKLEYKSLDGQPLKGWYILPFGYKQGKRYPVIVWVYLGQMFGDKPPEGFAGADFFHINSTNGLNLQVLAARGYVILLPSMPYSPTAAEPLSRLTNGVLPAVRKLIDIGVADESRIGVMGHSFGAYSTEGLITQTDLFKAAIALGGASSDWVSWHGTFDPRHRYSPFVNEIWLRMWNPESLGMPPWQDLDRYRRNSTISYVDRVHTPLLIFHGDLDAIPIEQDEEFFTELYRQSKRATFVRYWGEDHELRSPANILDMWNRVFAWFDEFVVRKPEDIGRKPN